MDNNPMRGGVVVNDAPPVEIIPPDAQQVIKAVQQVDPLRVIAVTAYGNAVRALASEADKVIVDSVIGEGRAADILNALRAREQDIEKARDGAVRPFNEFVKRLNAAVKPLTNEIAAARTIINDKVRARREQVDRERRAAEQVERDRLAREQAERDAVRRETERIMGVDIPADPTPAPAPIAPRPAANVTASAGGARVHSRFVWKWRVVTPGIVPPGMCSPDPDKLDAALKSYAGGTKPERGKVDGNVIDGVEFYVHEIIIGG